MLTFYYAKNSAAYAPHILLEDIGADYNAVRIDFMTGEQRSPAYLAVNPKGRLPSLGYRKGGLDRNACHSCVFGAAFSRA